MKIILIIGGIFMAIYGFCNNKCKHEVYTKDEANDKSVVVSPTEPTTNEKLWIQKGKNLFNKNGVLILNKRLDSNTASTYAANGYTTSNYIEVLPNTSYPLQQINAYHMYNKNKEKLAQGFYDTDSNDVITTTSDTKYIRVSTKDINQLMVAQSSTTTEYEPYIEKAIYTKNNNGVYEEFYNEADYYTKEEIDTVQTATVTVEPTDTSVGKAELTFRRAGKIVYVRIKLITYANKNQLSLANKGFTMPDFAKTSEENVVLFDNMISTGYGYSDETLEISLSSIARASIRKNSSGNYTLSGFKANSTTQEEENGITLTGMYIV